MSEQAYILKQFEQFYYQHKVQRIALYGIGLNTKYILENTADKHAIVGLMDAARAGETIYGYPVYSVEEAAAAADVIVIIAREAVVKLVYKRIAQLEQHGIAVYNLHGENLSEKYAATDGAEFEANPYWNATLAELQREIDAHDVISFDIFDTLLMRRIIRPHKELGFEAEKRLLIPRRDMVACLCYAGAVGKRVFLLSDMYFSAERLEELLKENGVGGYEETLVSCEWGATKESGELYEVLKAKCGSGNILHIGDNVKADIENAKKHGIDAYYVMNAYDMLLHSTMYGLLADVPTPEDNLMIGEFAANVLNSPFALHKGRGRVSIENMETSAAYFASMVGCFLQWLVQELNGCGSETLVLFLARDGYLMKRLYDWARMEFDPSLPESMYFPASREAVTEAYASYRGNYVQYARKAGLYSYQRVFAYDLATKGTTVSGLADILGIPLELVCFASFNIEEKFPPQRTRSMLGDYSYYDLPYHFLQLYELLEIMSAPAQTQFLYVDDDLNPVHALAESESGKQPVKIAEFQDCLCRQIQRRAAANPGWIWQKPLIQTADTILGLITPKYAIAGDCVKNAFVFESPPEKVAPMVWWDRLVN